MGYFVSRQSGAKYKPGDPVTVRADTPLGHHRTPWYVKGKFGRVEALHGEYRNPESLAYGGSGLPKQPLYRVEFAQADIWDGYKGPAIDTICLDIFEHWLEPD